MQTFEAAATILSTLAALAFVLIAAWFLLRWVGRRVPGQTGSRHIKVIDRVMVGQDKCLLLVRVAEKTMLIGMSSGTVTRLCDLEDPDGTFDVQPKGDEQTFSALLQNMMGKMKKPDGKGGD